MWDVLGLGATDDELEYDEADMQADDAQEELWQEEQEADKRRTPPNNVVGMPQRGVPPEMLVVEPRSFEEVPQVVMALKQRKSVILNLNLMDADTAQRCVDFVAGGTFALDGHQHRIGETIFLFTPGFVQISSYAPGESPASVPYTPPIPRRATAPAHAWTINGMEAVQ